MLRKYLYGLLISSLFFSDGIYANLTTPQSVALRNVLANKKRGISKSSSGSFFSNGGNNLAKSTPPASIVATLAKFYALTTGSTSSTGDTGSTGDIA